MLTTSQISFYGRKWGAVCQANAWRMERGRVAVAAEAGRGASEWHTGVWELADRYCVEKLCGMSVDVLRRACTAMVAGRWCSTKDLTNAQFDKLLALMDLLINPMNIAAVMRWSDDEAGTRKRCCWLIRNMVPEAYARHVSADKFGTVDDWEDLPIAKLRMLTMTLSNRDGRMPSSAAREQEMEVCHEPS